MNAWTGSFGILQIDELPRAGRADFAARRRQALRDAVVAERALVGRVRARVDVAAAVRAGLHAVAAAEAARLVHEDDAVRAPEGRADRADLRARRVRAVVAHLRHEEHLHPVAGRADLREAVVPAVRRVHMRVIEIVRIDLVALDPRAEAALFERHVVLRFARADAVAAADALVDIDDHAPPVIGGGVVGCLLRRAGDHVVPGKRCGARQKNELPRVLQECAAILIHRLRSCHASVFGQCGLWQLTHSVLFWGSLFL